MIVNGQSIIPLDEAIQTMQGLGFDVQAPTDYISPYRIKVGILGYKINDQMIMDRRNFMLTFKMVCDKVDYKVISEN